MAKSIVRGFSLFAAGENFAGYVKNIKLPDFKIVTGERRSGDLDFTTKVDLGMEALDLGFTLFGYSKRALKQFGLFSGSKSQFTIKGAILEGSDESTVTHHVTGFVTEMTPNEWVGGEDTEIGFVVSIDYYKLDYDSVIMHEIGEGKRIINGVDQLASLRKSLGL